jgi:hypothetical protein
MEPDKPSFSLASRLNGLEFLFADVATRGIWPMAYIFSILAEIDPFCGQVSTAMHNGELRLYATLTGVVVLSALLYPPRDDLDQV